jgi:hypothetical protein
MSKENVTNYGDIFYVEKNMQAQPAHKWFVNSTHDKQITTYNQRQAPQSAIESKH